jgi:pimeloyl-ACP methyl ester carboxylesterase
MKRLFGFSLTSLITGSVLNQDSVPKEALMSFEDLCKYRDYSAESHSLTTEDGYGLTLFHLKSSTPSTKRPILLVHGLTHSAVTFIINQSFKGPAFRLADDGHDVWLLNTRGNYLSRRHSTLDTKSKEYWYFTSNEIGRFDIPATVDYICEKTNQQKINYLGHSQGGFVLLFCLATRPSYNEKINLGAIFGAPGGGLISTNAQYLNVMLDPKFIEGLEKDGIYFIGDKPAGLSPFVSSLLQDPSKASNFIDRYDIFQANDTPRNLSIYLQQFCGGTSTTNLKYFNQLLTRNNPSAYFFDHGPSENLKKYGQEDPPKVDLLKIRSKIALFYGKHDKICTSSDGQNLFSLLPKENIIWAKLDYDLDHSGFAVSPYQQHMNDLLELLNKN